MQQVSSSQAQAVSSIAAPAFGLHTLPHPHPERPVVEPSLQPQPGWGLAKRLGFRFALIYILLYCLPFPLDQIPLGLVLSENAAATWAQAVGSYDALWQWLVPKVGKALFAVEITVFPNGSGDTTFNYVQVLCYFVLASLATLAWSLLARRSSGYPRTFEWLRVYARYVLALTMIGYGLAKVIQTQFPPPAPERLLQTYGSSSPMGLLWTFMGASTAYTFFAGFMETVGGLLLVPRRTATLGAIVVSGVMLNVVMLNFCYDVPVKLYSVHLLLMALWLTLPDLPVLLSVFLRTRPVAAEPLLPLFSRRWMNYASVGFKTLFIGFTLYMGFSGSMAFWKQMNDRTNLSPLAGMYDVESFARQAGGSDSTASDKSRWRRVIINDYKTRAVMAVQQADDQMPQFILADDRERRTVNLSLRTDPSKSSSLAYDMPEPGVLTLEGQFLGDTISARLRKTEGNDFLLTSRGFHWIDEYPYNR